MKKIIIYLFVFSFVQLYSQKSNDWKIKLKIGNELRLPILKYDNSKHTYYYDDGYAIFVSLASNTDIEETLNGFPLHYALEFKLSKTWSFEFQHTIHYDHVVFDEAIVFNPDYKSVATGLNQFFSDYKFSFFKYFTIDQNNSFNVSAGFSLNLVGDKYYILDRIFLTTQDKGYTSFVIESNYQYKRLSLGIGLFIIDDISAQLYANDIVDNGFGNYIFYFNLDFDILKF